MKSPHALIGDAWCNLMHAEPMWPTHGQYECRRCGRRHRVCWDQPLPVYPSATASRRATAWRRPPLPEASLMAESAVHASGQ
jgi:hypothetical protein